MSSLNMKRAIAVQLAFSMVGKPYIWGGDDPIQGFDCSGLIIEILKSVGLLPRSGDWTAQGLYDLFYSKGCSVTEPRAGCLAFFSSDSITISHVEWMETDDLTIAAAGGGKGTLTEYDAIRQNAYVKIRPLRESAIAFIDPFKDSDE